MAACDLFGKYIGTSIKLRQFQNTTDLRKFSDEYGTAFEEACLVKNDGIYRNCSNMKYGKASTAVKLPNINDPSRSNKVKLKDAKHGLDCKIIPVPSEAKLTLPAIINSRGRKLNQNKTPLFIKLSDETIIPRWNKKHHVFPNFFLYHK